MVSALEQIGSASAALTANLIKRRRERVTPNSSTIDYRPDAPPWPYTVQPPSPYYVPPRRIIEAPLPGPDPRTAHTPEEFVAMMRQLKAYTGQTLRGAQGSAGKLGELPKSTLHDALKSKSLPKPLLLRRFLESCGLTCEQIAVWQDTHSRIAMEHVS